IIATSTTLGLSTSHSITNSSNASSETVRIKYPEVRRDENVYDEYHGTKVSDPYRWLEDPDSNDTKAFVEAQNSITESFIKAYPKRQIISDRLKQISDYPKYSCPEKHGDKYYFHKNNGLQNQSVLYVQNSLDEEPKVFLDPNTLSTDGTVAITKEKFSYDGSFYAYALSTSGSDWKTIHVINTTSGKKLPEVLEKVKFTSMQWTHDNLGFFYTWYPEKVEIASGSGTEGDRNQKLSYHKVGTPQSDDILVVEFPNNPLWRMDSSVSSCGKYLFILPEERLDSNLLYFAKFDLEKGITGKLPLTQIVRTFEALYEYVTNDGKKAIFKTNKNAPKFKLIAIDLENFEEDKWVDLVPEHAHNVLDNVSPVGNDKLVVGYTEDAKDTLGVYSLSSGKLIRQLPLELGLIYDLSGDRNSSEIFYQLRSFLIPGIIYRVDLTKNEEPKVYREVKVNNFDPSQYKTSQVFYPSKDGTKIPMFIITRKDVKLDGSAPTFLDGYGGFSYIYKPTFKEAWIAFLQNFKGIVAISNIRGGGEYGEMWHDGGRLFKKQNSFDDFQSAAEYLIKNNYTSAKKLVIRGASNGGLLVGACINQRPDLFGAAIAEVGVMDMLKFHKFTIGYAWTSEYGSSDNPDEFKNLLKYSPLHNIKPPQNGTQYPATLLLTADHDDRVVPMHSLKHIATLQHGIGNLPQQTNPLLIRIEAKAGHGGGKPTLKKIEESTDILAFIARALNLEFN
ncbi:hypothetical protein QAD02_011392, partial [Eretmocerus hayati]